LHRSDEHQSLIIDLSQYQIYIGTAFLDRIRQLLQGHTAVIVIMDDNTQKFCLPLISPCLGDFHPIVIPPGEAHKNLDRCQKIWSEMVQAGADRHSIVINLGGGVIGDMGGFCAATYMRGIPFIQLPTTLLAQVDASIGGKLGIDFQGLKNYIGVFANPSAVFVVPDFLKSLPERQLRSGYAEVVKHALIGDPALWKKLKQIINPIEVATPELLVPTLEVKRKVVQSDPFEKGPRQVLNFGHTLGHAYESFYMPADEALLHGEAIAMGMAAALFLSVKKMNFSLEKCIDVMDYLQKVFNLRKIPSEDLSGILNFLKRDKKNVGNTINFTLLHDIGKPRIRVAVDPAEIEEAVVRYNDHCRNAE
jgi:3-dehydroquinate synthase